MKSIALQRSLILKWALSAPIHELGGSDYFDQRPPTVNIVVFNFLRVATSLLNLFKDHAFTLQIGGMC